MPTVDGTCTGAALRVLLLPNEPAWKWDIQRLELRVSTLCERTHDDASARLRPRASLSAGHTSDSDAYKEEGQAVRNASAARMVPIAACDQRIEPLTITSSGYFDAWEGYEPHRAFADDELMWGGRPDAQDALWLACTVLPATLRHGTPRVAALVTHDCAGCHVALQCAHEAASVDGKQEWHTLAVYRILDDAGGLVLVEGVDLPARAAAWGDGGADLVRPPSVPTPYTQLSEYSKVRYLMPATVHTLFTPDPSFYVSECCEGLWVCASRAAADVLPVACDLVRTHFPLYLRRLWGSFRAVRGSRCGGPMRIIILDNVCGERAGMVPELQDATEHRSLTIPPLVFTSREDLRPDITRRPFQITLHEGFHGADMVIRQSVDPYFHVEVQELYAAAKACGSLHRVDAATGEVHALYAAQHRDEYIAEMFTVFCGCPGDHLRVAGLASREDLRRRDPACERVLARYFDAVVHSSAGSAALPK
ncbi:hypothetical protein EON66_02620 [archaeon]|nr:MAG: hypothetical protein EON66_02620 [archaeon]